jgi:hypothetical protein
MFNLTGDWRKPRKDSSNDCTPHVTLITCLIKILYPSTSQRPIRTTRSAQPFTFNMFIPTIFGDELPRFATLAFLLSLPPRRHFILKHGGTNQPKSQGATWKTVGATRVTCRKFHPMYPQYQAQPCKNLVIRDLCNRSNTFSVYVFSLCMKHSITPHKSTEKSVLNISSSCTHNVRTTVCVLFWIFYRPISLFLSAETI